MSSKHIARKHSRAGAIWERHEGKGVEWKTNPEVDKAISLEVGRVVGSHFDYVLSDTKERSSSRGDSNSNNAFNNDSDNEKSVDLEQSEDGEDGEDDEDDEVGTEADNVDNREETPAGPAGPAGSDHNGESLEPTDRTPPAAGPHDVNVNRENDRTDRQYNGRGRGRASGRTGQPNRPAVVDYGLPDDVGGLVDEDEFEFVFDLEPSSDVDPAVLPDTLAGPVPTVLQAREAPVAGGSVLPIAPEVQPVVVPPIPTFDIPLDAPAAPVTNAVRNPMNPARQTLMTAARPELLADLLTDSGESIHERHQQQQQPCLKISDIIYSDYVCSAGSSDEAEIPNSQDDDTTAESMATASSSLRQEVKISLNLKTIDVTPIGLVGDGINVALPSHDVSADKDRTDSQDDLVNGNVDKNSPSGSASVSDDASQDDQDMASAEHDFRSLDYVLVREPLNVLGERTEQDADALLEQVINGVRDRGMGPNSFDELEVASPEHASYDREMSRSTEKSSNATNSVSCNNASLSDDMPDKTDGEACLSSPQSSSIQSDDHLMECDTQANASVQAKDDELLSPLESLTGVYNTTSSFHDDVGEPFIHHVSNVDDVLADSSRRMCSGLEELSGKPICDDEYDWSMSVVNMTYGGAKSSTTPTERDHHHDGRLHEETFPVDECRLGNDDENNFVFGQKETMETFELELNSQNEYNQDQISCTESCHDSCQKDVEENARILCSVRTETDKRNSYGDVEPHPYENNSQTFALSLAGDSGEEECNEVYINPLEHTTTPPHRQCFSLTDRKVDSWPEDLPDNTSATADMYECGVSQSRHSTVGVEDSPPPIDVGPKVSENRFQGYDTLEACVEANNVVVSGVASESVFIGDRFDEDHKSLEDFSLVADVASKNGDNRFQDNDNLEACVKADSVASDDELIMDESSVDHNGVEDLIEVCTQKVDLNLSDVTSTELKSMDFRACNQSSSDASTHLDGAHPSETCFRENLYECAFIPQTRESQTERMDTIRPKHDHGNFGIAENGEAAQDRVVLDTSDEHDTINDDKLRDDVTADSQCLDRHQINLHSQGCHDEELNKDNSEAELQVINGSCAGNELTERVTNSQKDQEHVNEEFLLSVKEGEHSETDGTYAVTRIQSKVRDDVYCDVPIANFSEEKMYDDVSDAADIGGENWAPQQELENLTEAQSMTRSIDAASANEEFPRCKDYHVQIVDHYRLELTKDENDRYSDSEVEQEHCDTAKDLEVAQDQNDSVSHLECDKEHEDTANDVETAIEHKDPVNDVETAIENKDPVNDVETAVEHKDPVNDVETAIENKYPVNDVETAIENKDPVNDVETAIVNEDPFNDVGIYREHEDTVNDVEAALETEDPVNDVDIYRENEDEYAVNDVETAIGHEDPVSDVETSLRHEDTVSYLENALEAVHAMNDAEVSHVHSAQLNNVKSAQEHIEPNNDLDVVQERYYDINYSDICQEHDEIEYLLGSDYKRINEDQGTDGLGSCAVEEKDEICSTVEVRTRKESNDTLDENYGMPDGAPVTMATSLQTFKSSIGVLEECGLKCRAGDEVSCGDEKCRAGDEVSCGDEKCRAGDEVSCGDEKCRAGDEVSCGDEGEYNALYPVYERSRNEPGLDDVTKRHGTGLEGQGDWREGPRRDDTKPASDQPANDCDVDLADELFPAETVKARAGDENVSIDREEKFLYQEYESELVTGRKEKENSNAFFDFEGGENFISHQEKISRVRKEINFDANAIVLKEKKVRFGHFEEGDQATIGKDHHTNCGNENESGELGASAPENVNTIIDNCQDNAAEINGNLWDVEHKDEEKFPTGSSFEDVIGDIISVYDDITDTYNSVDSDTKTPNEFGGPTRGLSNSSLELKPPCRPATPDKQNGLEDFDAMLANIRVSCEERIQEESGKIQGKENQIEYTNEAGEALVQPGNQRSGIPEDVRLNQPMEKSLMDQIVERVACDAETSVSKTVHTAVVEATDPCAFNTETIGRLSPEQFITADALDQEVEQWHSEEDFYDDDDILKVVGGRDESMPSKSENTAGPSQAESLLNADMNVVEVHVHIDLYETRTISGEGDQSGFLQNAGESDNPGGAESENIDNISHHGAETQNTDPTTPRGPESDNIDSTIAREDVGDNIDTGTPREDWFGSTDAKSPCEPERVNIDADTTRVDGFENVDADKPRVDGFENMDTDTPCGDWFDNIDTDTPREVKRDSDIETAVSFYAGVDSNSLEDAHEAALRHSECHPSLAGTTQGILPEVFSLAVGIVPHVVTSGMSSYDDGEFCHQKEASQEEKCDKEANQHLHVDVTPMTNANIPTTPMPARTSPKPSHLQTRSMTAADNVTLAESRYELDPAAKVILEATDLWLNKISDMCQTPTIEMEEGKLHEIADKCTSELLSLVKSPSEENGKEESLSSKSTPRDAINCDLSSSGKSVTPSNGPNVKSLSKPPSVNISRRSASMSMSTEGVPKSSSGTCSPGLVSSKQGISMGGHRSASTTSSTDIDIIMSRSGTRPNSRTDGIFTKDGPPSMTSSASTSGAGGGKSGGISDSEASLAGKNRTSTSDASMIIVDLPIVTINKQKENGIGSMGNLIPRICMPEGVQNVNDTMLTGLRPHSSGTTHAIQVNRPLIARPLSSRSNDGKTRGFDPAHEERRGIQAPQKNAGVLDLTDQTLQQADVTTKSPGRSKTVVLPSKKPTIDQCHEPHPPPVGKAENVGPKFKREIKTENGFTRIALRANSGTRMLSSPNAEEQVTKSQAVQDGSSPRRAVTLTPRRILKSQGTICDNDLNEKVKGGRQLFAQVQSSPRTSSFTQTDRFGRQSGQPSGFTRGKQNTSPRGTGDGEGKERRGRVLSVGIGDGASVENALKERTKTSPDGSLSHVTSRGEVKAANEIEAITQLNRQRMEPLKLREHAKKRPKAVKMMTMQEFEKIQAERHLTQAFARIQSSKPCVDCHMDAKVMDKTGVSTKRRRERVNYDSLIALENVKFLEMLRFKKSAYDRDEQLKDFKKSYKHMIMLGRHPAGWKETRGVDKLLTKGKHEEGSSQKHDILGELKTRLRPSTGHTQHHQQWEALL
ncbi:unnamed protein product [Lymnaea stagnalis]|uniref:Uncharacterized protein n=1 Tax=Lymnaea stagnalis TaxID=6523 RepID=A0AAV2HRD5_LYMST